MFNVKKQQKKNLRIFFRVSFQNDFKIIYFFVLNNSFDLNFGLKQISFFIRRILFVLQPKIYFLLTFESRSFGPPWGASLSILT